MSAILEEIKNRYLYYKSLPQFPSEYEDEEMFFADEIHQGNIKTLDKLNTLFKMIEQSEVNVSLPPISTLEDMFDER